VVVVLQDLLRLPLGHGPGLDGLAQLSSFGDQMFCCDFFPPTLGVVDIHAIVPEVAQSLLLGSLDALHLRVIVGLGSVNVVVAVPRHSNISSVGEMLGQGEAQTSHHQVSLHRQE